MIRVGISGWRYEPWRGVFYPRGLPQRRELEFAARHFPSVEINGSFYSLQRPTSYRAWYAATPDDFVFSVKGGRFITHMKRLKDVATPLANFFAADPGPHWGQTRRPGEAEEKEGRAGDSGSGHALDVGIAPVGRDRVEAPEVHHQRVAAAHAEVVESRRVGLHEPGGHAQRGGPAPGRTAARRSRGRRLGNMSRSG